MSRPVASSRSATEASASPRSNARTASSAGTAPVTQQRAGVEQAREAQRLEGVEEADPAAQRHQHRARRRRAPAGSSTSAARSRRPRPRSASWSALLSPTATSSRERVAQPRRPPRPRRSGRQAGDDQLAQLHVEEGRAVDGGARAAQPPHLPVEDVGVQERVPALGHRQAGDGAGARGDGRHRGLHPPQRLDQRRARPSASPSPRAAGTGRAGRAPRSACAGGRTRTTPPRSGRARRPRPAAGSAPRGCTRPGPGAGRR